MKYTLELNIKAIGKGRPRINTYTRTAYTPLKTKVYEEEIKLRFIEKYKNIKPSDKPLIVNIEAVYEPPKSLSNKKKEILLTGKYIKKPDCDNVAKTILDALNGLAYYDDSQVIELKINKMYGIKDNILIEITEVE